MQPAIFFIIGILLLGNMVGVYALFFRAPEQGNHAPDTLLNPLRSIVSQKDLIINVQPLRDTLEKIGKDESVSIYFEFLNTGANIAVNKDAEFWPASLLKLPVAMAVTKKIERGEWQWGNELVLMATDKNERFGTLYEKPIGTKLSIEELVKYSLAESDNTAHIMLVRNLEPEEFQDIYDHIGLSDFISHEGKISAKRYSVMLRALYNASYLSPENSQKLLYLLSQTKFTNYLRKAIPPEIIFAHKIGVSDDKQVLLDSGIVYVPGRPYLLSVMVNSSDEAHAQEVMNTISEKVYNYVISYESSVK